LECAQIIGHVGIFFGQRIDIANFDIGRLYARPFGARTEEPAPKAFGDHARCVKCIAWNEKLYVLTTAQLRTDNDALGRSIGVKHQDLNRIAEVIVIELVVADAVQSHRCVGVTMK